MNVFCGDDIIKVFACPLVHRDKPKPFLAGIGHKLAGISNKGGIFAANVVQHEEIVILNFVDIGNGVLVKGIFLNLCCGCVVINFVSVHFRSCFDFVCKYN